MKILKSRWIATGSVALAGLILAVLVPKAAKAIAATAVQVMNTSAAPAITQETSRQASSIVNLQCANPFSSYNVFDCYVVPAGQNLVVTSMTITSHTSSTQVLARLGPNVDPPYLVDIVASPSPRVTVQYSWAQGLVFTAGQHVGLGFSDQTNIYLTGYLTAN